MRVACLMNMQVYLIRNARGIYETSGEQRPNGKGVPDVQDRKQKETGYKSLKRDKEEILCSLTVDFLAWYSNCRKQEIKLYFLYIRKGRLR